MSLVHVARPRWCASIWMGCHLLPRQFGQRVLVCVFKQCVHHLDHHRGLAADQVSATARLLAVADVTDALRSDRPYRAGLPVERVRALLEADVTKGALCAESVAAVLDVLEAGAVAAPSLDTAA